MTMMILYAIGGVYLAILLLHGFSVTRPIAQNILGIVHRIAHTLAQAAVAWFVWIAKSIVSAHVSILKHLANRRDSLDPTESIEKD